MSRMNTRRAMAVALGSAIDLSGRKAYWPNADSRMPTARPSTPHLDQLHLLALPQQIHKIAKRQLDLREAHAPEPLKIGSSRRAARRRRREAHNAVRDRVVHTW